MIRKRRLDLGLLQREAADRIGVDVTTLRLWEWNRHAPSIRQLPAVIGFLGYVPFPVGESFGDRLRAYRRMCGLTRVELALQIGVDPSTLWRWEAGRGMPRALRCRHAVEQLLRTRNLHYI